MTKSATDPETRGTKTSTAKRRYARAPLSKSDAHGEAPGHELAPAQPAPKRINKTELVLDLLRREQGATLAEMIEATGWLPHSTRAALTGLKKKGHTLEKTKRDDVTCYRIVDAA